MVSTKGKSSPKIFTKVKPPPKRLRLAITKKQIKDGQRGNGSNCPVALAAQQATGRYASARYECLYVAEGMAHWEYLPTKRYLTFLHAVDRFETVKPTVIVLIRGDG
jgi:hypothetical protein